MKINAAMVMVPVKEYPVIFEDDSVDRAAEAIVEKFKEKDSNWRGYESLLVMNRSNEYVGLLTLRSILKAVETRELPAKNWHPGNLFLKKKRSGGGLQVRDLMRPLSSSFINVNSDAEQAVRIIMKNRINSVLVRDGDNFVGVVRVIDLIPFIEEMM
jgi:CBS domain-containing protein